MTSIAEMDHVFRQEYMYAKLEYERLCELFKDVCWYNFECKARHWHNPWRMTVPWSDITLLGARYGHDNQGEWADFPVWFEGTAEEAPVLPPHIVLEEIKEARRYRDACEQQLHATRDWAPDGALYKELVRTTLVGRDFQSRERG